MTPTTDGDHFVVKATREVHEKLVGNSYLRIFKKSDFKMCQGKFLVKNKLSFPLVSWSDQGGMLQLQIVCGC